MMHIQSEKSKQRFAVSMRSGWSALLPLAMLTAFSAGARAQHTPAGQLIARQAVAPATLAGSTVGTPVSAKSPGEETTVPAKPGSEGIKVHGHWVVDLKNADGKVIDHRDFENSLVTNGFGVSGDQVLAALLSGNAVSGDPGVLLVAGTQQSTDASQLCGNGSQGVGCYLLTTATSPLAQLASVLKFSLSAVLATQTGLGVVVNYSPSVSWVLSGAFTVPTGVTAFNSVQTALPLCGPFGAIDTAFGGGTTESFKGSFGGRNGDLAPKACVGNPATDVIYPAILTSTTITSGGQVTPLAVTAGQIISITVTLSFS